MTTMAGVNSFSFFERFFALSVRKPGDTQGSQSVEVQNWKEEVEQTAAQQYHRHVHAHAGTVGVSYDGVGLKGFAHFYFLLDHPPHDTDRNRSYEHPRNCAFWLVFLVDTYQCGNYEQNCQCIKAVACNIKGFFLEIALLTGWIGSDSFDHDQNADS